MSRSSAALETTRRRICVVRERARVSTRRVGGFRALARILGAAAFGCGIFFCAAPFAKDRLDEPGPLPQRVVERLTLVDAERFGNRIVAVGDRGYIVIS